MVKKKILIIDDDPDFVGIIKEVLEKNSFLVDYAYNSIDGINKIKRGVPDLIILDQIIEDIDSGTKICYELRREEAYRNIPVLMVSSIVSTAFKFIIEVDGHRYIEANDYIEKPVESSVLLERVNKLLETRKAVK